MLLDELVGRHVGMLQGPNGPFFKKVARALRARGARITKVNLNAADWLFFHGPDALNFRGHLDDFGAYVERLIDERFLDCLMLFGDSRPYHRVAIDVAKARQLDVYVFEEGYLRPNFVTLEKGGVNGNSSLPRSPAFYRKLMPKRLPEPRPVGNVFWWSALWALMNSLALTFLWFCFPRYRHHRNVNFFYQVPIWLRAGIRKAYRWWRDHDALDLLTGKLSGHYFLVPLQVASDSQIRHSQFLSVNEFLEKLVHSFAKHAPPATILVVKDHPMGRPYDSYDALLRRLGKRLGISNRILQVDCVHLPTLLRHARGTIVINSTVGLSSILHGTPTKCLGKAIYNMPGLTHQGPLSAFLRDPGQVDERLYRRFHWYVRTTTQLPGSVWTDLFDVTEVPNAAPSSAAVDDETHSAFTSAASGTPRLG